MDTIPGLELPTGKRYWYYNTYTAEQIRNAVTTLMALDHSETYRLYYVSGALSLLSNYTGISDLDWLTEVFRTGEATSPEEAVQLFNEELLDNARQFGS